MKNLFPDRPTVTDRPDTYYLLVHVATKSIIASALMNLPDADRINRLATVRFRTLIWTRAHLLPKDYRWQADTYCPNDLLQLLSSRE